MKKIVIVLLLSAALLCAALTLFSACGGKTPPAKEPLQSPAAMESAAPTAAATEEPEEPKATRETIVVESPAEGETLEFSADLDLDGTEERITIEDEGTEDDPFFVLKVASGAAEPISAVLPVRYISTVLLADLDAGDSFVELIVSGDMMSVDYTTHCFRYDGTLLETEVDGAAIGVEDGVLTVSDQVDVLGTRTGEMIYTLDENYEFQPARTMWMLGEPDFSAEAAEFGACLTVKKELPVALADGTASKLPVGTKLWLLETDGKSIANFRAEDGAAGSIAIMPVDYGFEIEGVSEYDYFELVPYAG